MGTEKKEGGIKAYKKPNEEIWKERKKHAQRKENLKIHGGLK